MTEDVIFANLLGMLIFFWTIMGPKFFGETWMQRGILASIGLCVYGVIVVSGEITEYTSLNGAIRHAQYDLISCIAWSVAICVVAKVLDARANR